MGHSEKESTLKVFGRQPLSAQMLGLMEQNGKLRLENISLERRLQIITIKISLLRKKLFRILKEFEDDKQGDI